MKRASILFALCLFCACLWSAASPVAFAASSESCLAPQDGTHTPLTLAQFKEKLSEYGRGKLSQQDFLNICDEIVASGAGGDANLERIARTFRATINSDLGNYFDAVQDGQFLLGTQLGELNGMQILAVVNYYRHNFAQAVQFQEKILAKAAKEKLPAGEVDVAGVKKEMAELKQSLSQSVKIDATALASEFARSPDAAVQKYQGKTLLVTGTVLTGPDTTKDMQLMLFLSGGKNAKNIACFLAPSERPFMDEAEVTPSTLSAAGSTVTMTGTLQNVDGAPALAPSWFIGKR